MFGTLLSEIGSLDGKKVLDLYAGSGAVGLEALSRGARGVLFVEADARAAAVIRANVKAVGLPGARVMVSKAERLPSHPAPRGTTSPGGTGADAMVTGTTSTDGGYDVVFADPPYAVTQAEIATVLGRLAHGWLNQDALVIVERATRDGDFGWPPGYVPGKSRRYGEATFWYGRRGLLTSVCEE